MISNKSVDIISRPDLITYNRLRNSRIRALVYAGLAIIILQVFVFKYYIAAADGGDRPLWHLAVATIIICIPIVALSAVPFHQALKKMSDTEFVTYRKVAWLKLNVANFQKPKDILIEQGANKLYQIVMKFHDGKGFVFDTFLGEKDALAQKEELEKFFGD